MFIVEKGEGWQLGERVTGSHVVPSMHTYAHISLSRLGDALEMRSCWGAMVGMLGTIVLSSPLWDLGRHFLVLVLYVYRGFFYQIGQFRECQGPLWARFKAQYRFRQC